MNTAMNDVDFRYTLKTHLSARPYGGALRCCQWLPRLKRELHNSSGEPDQAGTTMTGARLCTAQ